MRDDFDTMPKATKSDESTGVARTPGGRSLTKRAYRRRLKTLVSIRVAMADVVRDLETLPVDVDTARARTYALQVLATVVEKSRQVGDLAERLKQVEEAVAVQQGKSPSLRRA